MEQSGGVCGVGQGFWQRHGFRGPAGQDGGKAKASGPRCDVGGAIGRRGFNLVAVVHPRGASEKRCVAKQPKTAPRDG